LYQVFQDGSMPSTTCHEPEVCWQLLYTKPHAEAWAEINLRNQGFVTLMPRVVSRSGIRPLFPRYLFVGRHPGHAAGVLRSTLGVLYVVHCGDLPARVPDDVIAELRSRMNAQGVVHLEDAPKKDPLFAKRERERVRTLMKLAAAGFRVKSA
jgi:hypothetical protein